VRVAIIGAGIAGLATAFNLETEARRQGLAMRLDVFEGADQIGGKLQTVCQDGFLIETGPNGWLDNEPATGRLLSRLGLQALILRSEDSSRHRFLQLGGRLQEVPLTPGAFLKSSILPAKAKLRMAAELFIPARKDLGLATVDPQTDETVYAFGRRRLGQAFAETMLDPMVKGIFGGDARRLSLAAAFPRMVELEKNHGGLLKAMFKLARRRRKNGGTGGRDGAGAAGPGGTLHSFGEGMAVLPRKLQEALYAGIHAGRPITRLWREGDGWWLLAGDQKQGPFAAVIDAAPAHAAALHLDDPDLRSLLASIRYVPMAVITLAFNRWQVAHPLQGFGMLNPSSERRRLLGVLWSSSIFKGRARDGKVLMRCMAGGTTSPEVLDLSDTELLRLCLQELGGLYGLQGDPERTWIIRHGHAIAQYEPGHLARLAAIAAALDRHPGLFLAGSSYRGISVNHCIAEAERTASVVLGWLSRKAEQKAAAVGGRFQQTGASSRMAAS
jgi:oxygen-dependent protoporphyrinogen oxidase